MHFTAVFNQLFQIRSRIKGNNVKRTKETYENNMPPQILSVETDYLKKQKSLS